MRSIPLSPPDIGELEINYVIDALKSGWITTGPKTKLFERKIAEYCRTPRAVCLNSATASAELTLHVLGVGPGDEVITSAYTYTASASVAYHVGAKVVLVDVEPGTFHIDYAQLESAITEKTKVIVPVDIGGVPCDYDKIMEIVNRKKNLFRPKNRIQRAIGHVIVMADCAHGFGATYHGKPAGSLTDFTTFSFHAVKNLTTAEGGAVTWRDIPGIDNDDLYHEYMLLSLHGQSKDALAKTQLGAWEYDIKMTGFKCNMTDIMAAMGLAQLERYPAMLARRKEIVEQYDAGLRDEPVEIMAHQGPGFESSRHLYLIRLLGKSGKERNDFITAMAENGIACNVHYKPLPMHTAYKALGFSISDYPHAYEMFENEVTLPLYTKLTDEDVEYVLDNVKSILHARVLNAVR